MALYARLVQSLSTNPWAWLFFALFVIAEYGNWHKGRDLTRLCDAAPRSPYYAANPVTPQEVIENICGAREAAADLCDYGGGY